MKSLKTVRLKPNPAGKDRGAFGATQAQLGAEWVDFQNTGTQGVSLDDVRLKHVAYPPGNSKGHWDLVTTFTGTLPPGKVVRVHSGSGPEAVLAAQDRSGADYHVFTNRDRYVWNNDRSDWSGLFQDGRTEPIDCAGYSPNPPEGRVLVRSGDKLL